MGFKAPRAWLVLLSIAAIVLVSGCISDDPSIFAKANPLVADFLEEHPNAEIRLTHYSAEEAQAVLDDIMEDCQKRNMTAKEYYKVIIEDPDSGLQVTAWVDWGNKLIECAIKRGGEPGTEEGECKPRYKVRCYEGHSYWYDSCGNREEKREACSSGCDSGRCIGQDKCEAMGGYCSYTGIVEQAVLRGDIAEIIASTKTETSLTGMIHAVTATNAAVAPVSSGGGSAGTPLDSCESYYICPDGQKFRVCEFIKEEKPVTCVESDVEGAGKVCTAGEVVVRCVCKANPELLCESEDTVCRGGYEKSGYWCPDNGICCIPEKDECAPEYVSRCYGGHVYWFDSCGNKVRKREYCAYGCDEGKCKPPPADEKCYETDGGYDIYERGVCESGSQRLEDHCNSDGTLTEKYCADDTTIKWNSTACPEGYVCSEGACRPQTCTDSDDGKDYYEKGEITQGENHGFDGCNTNGQFGSDPNMLMEYFCDEESKIEVDWYSCPNGCEDGACLLPEVTPPTCSDSDGGMNYYIKGVVTDKHGIVVEDECKNHSAILEKFCGPEGGFGISVYTCPNGCSYENGACNEEAICRNEEHECSIEDIPCCEGLEEVPLALKEGDQCIAATCGSICRPCGNGICDDNENECSCPEDCNVTAFCGSSTLGSCTNSSECIDAGCSGSICANITEVITTTCEWLDCYDNEVYNLSCGCVENTCQWA